MSSIVLFFLLFSFDIFADDAVVFHPAPTDPIFLNENFYGTVKKQIPAPPKSDDKLQKNDEKELVDFQKTRTEKDCDRAKGEVVVSLKNFFGLPHGVITDKEIEILGSFFEQIRNDGDFFIQKLKKDYARKRPYLYMKELNPCVRKEVTDAYPSGHAALSRLYAHILGDFYPQNKEKFITAANGIGKRRVISGVHHPTDIKGGQELGDLVYKELQKSEKYKIEFNKYLAKISPEKK